jgi:hypothetical protein
MSSTLVQAIADNMAEATIEEMVGNFYARQLFGIVAKAADITEETRPEELAKVDAIRDSPVLAAMSLPAQTKLRQLCVDAKELIEMDSN